MSRHTAGKWVAEFETVGNGGWREPDDVATIYCGEKIIATYSTSYGEYPESRDENEANVRLMSAAPDLLEALIDALCALEVCGKDYPAESKARAAIARATQPLPTMSEEK